MSNRNLVQQITLVQAKQILDDASAVIWDEQRSVSYPSTSDLTGEPENEFCYISYTDDKGLDYFVKFTEENNQNPTVVGSSLFLNDTEGDQIQLTILVPAQLTTPLSLHT